MANFPLLRANQAAWIGAVQQSEFWTFDRDRTKTINADDGSTHAPSTQIVIGGAGLNMTGRLDASDLRITTGWPVLTGDRTLDVWGHALLASRGGTYADPDAWNVGLGVTTKVETSGPGTCGIVIPKGPDGSTLDEVRVWSRGLSGHASGTLVRPIYGVSKVEVSPAFDVDLVSSLTTDAHASDGSDWTDYVMTTIPAGSLAVDSSTHVYLLNVATPYNTSIGAQAEIVMIGATYTCSQLRP